MKRAAGWCDDKIVNALVVSAREMDDKERKRHAKNIKTLDPLAKTFDTLGEFIEFWDTHSTADYPEAFREIEGTTNVKERRFYRVALDARVGQEPAKRARAKGERRIS